MSTSSLKSSPSLLDVPEDDGPSTEELKSMSRKERKKLEKERAFKKQLEGMETAEAEEGIGGQFTVSWWFSKFASGANQYRDYVPL